MTAPQRLANVRDMTLNVLYQRANVFVHSSDEGVVHFSADVSPLVLSVPVDAVVTDRLGLHHSYLDVAIGEEIKIECQFPNYLDRREIVIEQPPKMRSSRVGDNGRVTVYFGQRQLQFFQLTVAHDNSL